MTSNTSFEQKIDPVYDTIWLTLGFRLVRDRNKIRDLKKINIELKCRILRPNGDKLDYDVASAAANVSPFYQKTPQSFICECNFTVESIKLFFTNRNYAQNVFIETEFLHNKEVEESWWKCQRNSYEQQTYDFTRRI